MATNNSTKFNIKHGAAGSLPTTKTNGTLYVATKDDKRAELHVDLNGERYVISESLPVDNVLKDNSTNPVQNKVVKDALTAIETTLSGKSDDDHTHNYAGSTSPGGDANAAKKLTTNAGSATQPVYFENGVPIATTYTLEKSVPSNAKFTDTNTKVTSVGNHYTPSANADSAIAVAAPADTVASWGSTAILTGFSVSRDAKGHVTDITPTGVKMPTNPNTNTTYDLSAPANKTNENVTINLTAGGSGSGTDSVKIKGSGATSVTTNENGHITISSTDTTYTALKNPNAIAVKRDSNSVISYDGSSAKTINVKTGENMNITSDTSGNITFNSSDTTYKLSSPTNKSNTEVTIDLKVDDTSNTPAGTVHIKGSGATSVTSDGDGYITISSTDNNTTYQLKTDASKTNGNVQLKLDASSGTDTNVTIKGTGNATVTTDANKNIIVNSTDHTYSLSTPTGAANGNVTINLDAGGSGTGTDSVIIKGSGATGVTTDTNGNIIVSSTDTKYTHPSHTAKSNGFYKVTVDALGHVSSTTAVTKTDITALGIPGSNTDTHYASKNVVGKSTATSNTTSALTNGNVYLNSVENNKVTSTHKISGSGSTTVTTDTSGNIVISSTDTNTKNTAGSTNTSSKIFLIGATSQAANPQTYSHDTAYVGTDGCLYSGGKKVLTSETSLSKGTDTTATATIDGTGSSNNKKPTFTAVTDTAVSGHKITDTTTTYTLDLSDYVTSDELNAQLSTAMVFKGSLGTNGTITALPTASSSTIGDTYKVITAGTYASIAAKVGDIFICNNDPSWVLIPSGDEPSGTVTSIKVGDGLLGGTITTSGEISHADTSSQSSITASGRRYITGVTLDTFGHVTGLTTGTETVTNTNTTYDLTAPTATQGKVKLNLTAGGSGSGTDSIGVVGAGATTVTSDGTNITITSTDTTYTALKNPTSLTVKGNGTQSFVYDGSSAKTLNIKPGTGTSVTSDTSGNITINHSNSVTAGTAQGDATKTLTFGGTFTIPTVTYDAQGHITGKGTTTMTMPANPNVDTKVTNTLNTSSKYYLTGTTSSTTNTGKQIFRADVYVDASGNVVANKVYNAVWNDYAEFFPRGEETEAGDIIALDLNSDNEVYIKATKNNKAIVGVESNEYGHILGGKPVSIEENMKNYIPVGLAGRVWVKVQGNPKKGDYIGASDIPGVGEVCDDKYNAIGICVDNNLKDGKCRIKII